nr:hypothetical protein [Arthrobacter sp. PAMC25284]
MTANTTALVASVLTVDDGEKHSTQEARDQRAEAMPQSTVDYATEDCLVPQRGVERSAGDHRAYIQAASAGRWTEMVQNVPYGVGDILSMIRS